MKKINKNNDYAFIIREDLKGNKHLTTSGESMLDLLKSRFNGEIIYGTYRNKSLYTSVNEYYTKEKNVIKGFFNVEYYVYNGIKYYEERNAEKIIDVVVRTVMDEYFKSISSSDEKEITNINVEDKIALINLINFYLRKTISCVKVTKLSDLKQINSINNEPSFKTYDEINKEANEESIEPEYYMPSVARIQDDLSSNNAIYPDKIHVSKNEVLYYCGEVKKPGNYYGRNAKGVVVSNGKHVFSTSPQIFQSKENGEKENKYMIYPNVIYNVSDIKYYLRNNLTVRYLLNQLTEVIIKANNFNEVENVVSLEDNKNIKAANILKELKEYSVDVEYIMYSNVNPCVRSKKLIKGEQDIYAGRFGKNR